MAKVKKDAAAETANDVDAMLDDEAAEPVKKVKAKAKAKPEAAVKGKPKAAAKAAPKSKAKAKDADVAEVPDSAVKKALLKVKKATTYAAIAEANDFNIRTVRRTARQLRDAGLIDLSRDGQTVYISAAV